MTSDVVRDFVPTAKTIEQAMYELQRLGFEVTGRGQLSFSVRGSRSRFERCFGTRLSEHKMDPGKLGHSAIESFYYPGEGAPWKPRASLAGIIDDAYIQWPHIYMDDLFSSSEPSPLPPHVNFHHLRVPGDVTLLLNVPAVHRAGGTGQGVRVVMIDSGFAHGHAYFQQRGYSSSTVLAPGASDVDLDGNGHGTGESANLLAIAPDLTFIGVKLDNENNPSLGASILEGFHEALRHSPQVISVSLGFDLVSNPITRAPRATLPNSLVALEAEIQAAVANGIVVVFSAGNGHVAWPGMMPDVISAGGVFVAANGQAQASDYASAFSSRIYPGRIVPDFCGLVGLRPNADYIMLPIPSGCEIDRGNATHDGTMATDGWGVFSGTSAAAPQLAGVCALLLEKNPGLTPGDIKSVLARTARDVTRGNANPASNQGTGVPATQGPDGATGAGLVDAFAAWRQV